MGISYRHQPLQDEALMRSDNADNPFLTSALFYLVTHMGHGTVAVLLPGFAINW